MTVIKKEQPNEKSIYAAVTYLIEECERNGLIEKAKILRKAVAEMDNIHEVMCDNDYDAVCKILSKMISMEKDQLLNFVDYVESLDSMH